MQDKQEKQKQQAVKSPNLISYLEKKSALTKKNQMINSMPMMDRPKMIDYYKQKEMKMKKEIMPKPKPKKSLFQILETKQYKNK